MAKIEFSGIDEIALAFEGLEDIDELTNDLLDAGGRIIKNNVERGIFANHHFKTGAMLSSIKVKKKKDKDGKSVVVTADGRDAKGTRNAEKAFVLNYGRSNMAGSRFWSTAEEKSSKEIEDISEEIAETFYKEKGLK